MKPHGGPRVKREGSKGDPKTHETLASSPREAKKGLAPLSNFSIPTFPRTLLALSSSGSTRGSHETSRRPSRQARGKQGRPSRQARGKQGRPSDQVRGKQGRPSDQVRGKQKRGLRPFLILVFLLFDESCLPRARPEDLIKTHETLGSSPREAREALASSPREAREALGSSPRETRTHETLASSAREDWIIYQILRQL